jgi:hypothetical protein
MNAARWISLTLAAASCAFAVLLQPAYLACYAIAYLIVPLGAIWYGDELGSMSGLRLDKRTPGIMVKIAGWILLLITPLAVYAFKLRLEITP